MNNPIWRLLRRNMSKAQLAGYALANFTGLAILLTAFQFYSDVSSLWQSEDSFITRDYMVISRRLSTLGSLFGSKNREGFSQEEINRLSSQPWVRRVGAFTPASFSVGASLDTGHGGISTALFLESIPDEFFDVRPSGWTFTPVSPVPIIISKEYLSLYNFGFASSRGLPQISENMVGMIPLKLSVSGAGRQVWLPAKIVGFSNRLGTIAVPEAFMKWANENFSDTPDSPPAPSRLIVDVSSPGDPAIASFLTANNLEVAGDKAESGRASYFLTLFTIVAASVGIIISLLAFFILMLSIYLLLQKNREKTHTLMILGYSPAAVSRHYIITVGLLNTLSFLAAMTTMLIASHFWTAPLAAIGVTTATPWLTILLGVAITAVITVLNTIAITGKLRSSYRATD